MGDAIEPSEILRTKGELPKEKSSLINPQVRFLARFFDYSLFLLVLSALHFLIRKNFPFSAFDQFIPLEYFSWIPIEAYLLSSWGATPGKFLLRTKLTQGRNKKLDFQTALKRSFNVWFRGIGMGIPVVNILCMLVASSKLRVMGMTSWDREDNFKVAHLPLSRWRIISASIVVVLGFFVYYSAKHGMMGGK